MASLAEPFTLSPPFTELKLPPPDPLPLLVAQTDLFYYIPQPLPLLAQEPFPLDPPPPLTKAIKQNPAKLNAAPYVKPTVNYVARFKTKSPSPENDDASDSDIENESESHSDGDTKGKNGDIKGKGKQRATKGSLSSSDEETETSASTKLFERPSGEVGRPGSGGYSLHKVMKKRGWNKTSLKELKVSAIPTLRSLSDGVQAFVHSLVKKHLDETQTVSNQSPMLIRAIQDAVSHFFFAVLLNNSPFCRLSSSFRVLSNSLLSGLSPT